MSLTVRPIAPNLEAPTTADDGRVHALSGRVTVPIKDAASLT